MRSTTILVFIAGFLTLGLAAYSWQAGSDTMGSTVPFFSAVTPGPRSPATAAPTVDATGTAAAASNPEIARPSNAGGPGAALGLTGDAVAGKAVFAANCVRCHAQEGKGGIANPGSDDGTVPPLNPIDSTLVSTNAQTFAYNLDLFLEHGSTPSGASPVLSMPAWGDSGKLQPQQIADVIAYVISLNK